MLAKLFLPLCLACVIATAACSSKGKGQPGQAALPPSQSKLTPAESAGGNLYDNNCAECHENPHPELLKQPPSLRGIFDKKTLPSGAPAKDAQVRETIVAGRGTMPAFDRRLQAREVSDLIAYLHKLE